MIEDSDNTDATDLWNAVGGANGIGSFNAAVGLADTSPSRCVQCPGFPWPGWGLTMTIPTDQIALLRDVAEPSPLLTDAERSYALQLMESVTLSQRWGVSGGVPPQATVALKNGWLPLDQAETDWQINSIGWISGLQRDYLMAVLSLPLSVMGFLSPRSGKEQNIAGAGGQQSANMDGSRKTGQDGRGRRSAGTRSGWCPGAGRVCGYRLS
ncbi:MAG: serine hydrolase [Streptosporangiaceae bacterium]